LIDCQAWHTCQAQKRCVSAKNLHETIAWAYSIQKNVTWFIKCIVIFPTDPSICFYFFVWHTQSNVKYLYALVFKLRLWFVLFKNIVHILTRETHT
jgi:hypothetical protein